MLPRKMGSNESDIQWIWRLNHGIGWFFSAEISTVCVSLLCPFVSISWVRGFKISKSPVEFPLPYDFEYSIVIPIYGASVFDLATNVFCGCTTSRVVLENQNNLVLVIDRSCPNVVMPCNAYLDSSPSENPKRKPPQDTTGYSVTENDLTIDDFSVDVRCASGYKGNLAKVVSQDALTNSRNTTKWKIKKLLHAFYMVFTRCLYMVLHGLTWFDIMTQTVLDGWCVWATCRMNVMNFRDFGLS